MAAVASRPRRPANSSKSGALGNLRFARAAFENRLLTRLGYLRNQSQLRNLDLGFGFSTPKTSRIFWFLGNSVSGIDMSGLTRNGPIYSDNSRNGHMMVSMSNSTQMGLGYVGVEGVSRLNPRAPDFPPRTPTTMHHHKPNTQLFGNASSGSSAGAGGPGTAGANLNTLLMYQPSVPPKHMPQPQPHMPYQSLLERGVGVSVGGWNGEEEERKPRPIGTERAWKLTAGEDWSAAAAHAHHPYQMTNDHDRYQNISGMGGMGVNMSVGVGGVESVYGGVGVGVGVGGGAAAAALSLMHALPLQYLPGAPPATAPPPPQMHTDHTNWDHPHRLAPTSAADKTVH
ncbi:hypothetical protein EVAR_83992_1 [Eumeta japonica]|uniref:Uncharacterized protein n=1 Tax=Eumeta variegata TaxID=151549 RepID=A0A4C1VPG9_EUMVA|nr:hypothetical protein EVAR_83992_1 [Eumeta japonica]